MGVAILVDMDGFVNRARTNCRGDEGKRLAQEIENGQYRLRKPRTDRQISRNSGNPLTQATEHG